MIRFVATAALAMLALLQAGCSANTPGAQQTLVDRATLTVQDMMTQNVSQDPKTLLRRAKGVMICPRIFKAGFFFGGEGGNCVLLARAGNGTWSYPAFYTIGSGSFGFQFGIEDNELFDADHDRARPECGARQPGQARGECRDRGGDAGCRDPGIDHGGGRRGYRCVLGQPGPVRRRRAGGQPDVGAIVVGPVVLRPAARGPAIGDADAGQQPGRRSAARRAYAGMAAVRRRLPPPQQQPQAGYAPAYPQYQPQGTHRRRRRASAGGRGPVQEQNLPPPH